MRLRIRFAAVRFKPLEKDKRLSINLLPEGRRGRGFAGFSERFRQKGREQDRSSRSQQRLFEDTLQLPDVARPMVTTQTVEGFRCRLARLSSRLKRRR